MSVLPPTAPRILFVVDAGPTVGGGHVMRSLTLAQALEAEGAACTFLAPPAVQAVLAAFDPAMARLETGEADIAELVEIAAERATAFDAIVIDHYGLSAPEHRRISQNSAHPGRKPTLVIDDLANRPLGADLILDSGPARQAQDYGGLASPYADLLLGPNSAPVRPAFAALRKDALARRAQAGPVRRILVSLGLTDVGAITARAVALILPQLDPGVALDVVLGGGAPSLPALRTLAAHEPRLTLHVDTQDMPRLTLQADLAVGAGGSTSWERCVLALPSLLLVLADNQREAAQALANADAVLKLDVAAPEFDAAFRTQISRLLDDPRLRDQLSAASAAVCDGRGAARVAARFLGAIGQSSRQVRPEN